MYLQLLIAIFATNWRISIILCLIYFSHHNFAIIALSNLVFWLLQQLPVSIASGMLMRMSDRLGHTARCRSSYISIEESQNFQGAKIFEGKCIPSS
ncbi:unnamed protein product [Nezara viridula]|uniref:Uncharacterized protein n=1 Tax=Nezara viridula TaxID=85310 RepID=A0A9P0HLQ8_NEZVI|nr:unnamed protein product [Nezara viridula]